MEQFTAYQGGRGVPWVQIMENEFECLVVSILVHSGYHGNPREHSLLKVPIPVLASSSCILWLSLSGLFLRKLLMVFLVMACSASIES